MASRPPPRHNHVPWPFACLRKQPSETQRDSGRKERLRTEGRRAPCPPTSPWSPGSPREPRNHSGGPVSAPHRRPLRDRGRGFACASASAARPWPGSTARAPWLGAARPRAEAAVVWGSGRRVRGAAGSRRVSSWAGKGGGAGVDLAPSALASLGSAGERRARTRRAAAPA